MAGQPRWSHRWTGRRAHSPVSDLATWAESKSGIINSLSRNASWCYKAVNTLQWVTEVQCKVQKYQIYDKNIQRLTFFHSSPLFSFFTGNDERIKLAVINCEQSLDVTSIIDLSSSCFRLTRWQAGGVMDHYNVLYMSRHGWIFFRQATVKTGWWWLEGYGVLETITCLKSLIFAKKKDVFQTFLIDKPKLKQRLTLPSSLSVWLTPPPALIQLSHISDPCVVKYEQSQVFLSLQICER